MSSVQGCTNVTVVAEDKFNITAILVNGEDDVLWTFFVVDETIPSDLSLACSIPFVVY